MVQSQGFLNPHVPPSSPLAFCAAFSQQHVGQQHQAPPTPPKSWGVQHWCPWVTLPSGGGSLCLPDYDIIVAQLRYF